MALWLSKLRGNFQAKIVILSEVSPTMVAISAGVAGDSGWGYSLKVGGASCWLRVEGLTGLKP